MKRKLISAAFALLLGWSNASAQLENGTVYWIQDASSGQFMSQGDDWATKAVTQDVGGLGFEAIKMSEGVYTLKNIMWNTVRNADVGLGVDQYVDQSPAEYTLTASGAGFLISTGGNYLVNNGSENDYKEKPIGKTTDAGAATVWKFLTKSEYDAAIQAYKDSKAATYATNLGYSASTVTALESILSTDYITKDYTSSITNASLSSSDTGWTHGRLYRGNSSGGWAVGDGCAEFWNGCGYATQTVSDLPNGLYKVTFVGTYRPSSNTNSEKLASEKTSSPAFVYANDARIEFKHWIDVPAKANGRSGITTANGYGSSFYTYVSDGTLALGVVADGWTDAQNWIPFGQFTLTYYSDAVSEEDATAIIETAEGIIGSHMGSSVRSALSSALNTFKGSKTIANYNSLQTAINNANASIASYAALLTAITNANNYTTYKPVFEAGADIYSSAISTAQGVYDAETVVDCSDAITTLTNGIHSAYESDYSDFVDDYAYNYSTLLSEDLTEWTESNFVVMKAEQHWNGLPDQRYYEQSGAEWGSSSWSHEASQTATLPAGNYVMSVTARASVDVVSSMSVQIGSNTPMVASLANKGAEGRGIMTDGTGSYQDGTYANGIGRGWEYRFIAFTLAEESPVTFKFNASVEGHLYNWVSIANPLLKGDVHPNQIKLNQVHDLATQLKSYNGHISPELYAAFADDLAAADAATVDSDDLDDIITYLQTDIYFAQKEKEAFDRGAAMNALIAGEGSVVLSDEATAANWSPTPTLNTWSTEADETGMVTPFLQDWINREAGALSDNEHNYLDIKGMQNGYYEVSALVRIYSESGEAPDASSAYFTVNGVSDNLLDGTNFEYNGMKGVYKTVSIRMQIEDALNIGLEYSGANFNWISWKNLTVTYLFSSPADLADYTALNNAIATAEAKPLGFENGEYAPYNNIDALELLAAAKAIDQFAVNSKAAVQAATADLNNAVWTANVGDVEAIYNGDFAEGQGSPAANIQEYGWTRTNGWGQFKDDADATSTSNQTAYYNQPGSLQYGNAGIYTMPLKENTIYNLTFKYASWEDDSNGGMTVSVLNDYDGMAAMIFPANKTQYKNDGAFVTKELVFATGAAGNYVLTLENSGNTVITDVSITKAASQELAFDEDEDMPAYAPGIYPTVSLTRTIKAGINTVVLPFDMTQGEVESTFGVGSIVYVISDYNSEDDNVTFIEQDGIYANEPVLVKATVNSSDTYTFGDMEVAAPATTPESIVANGLKMVGNYNPAAYIPASEGSVANYVVSNGALYEVDVNNSVTIRSTRAYFSLTAPEAAKSLKMTFGGEASNVDAPEVVETEEPEVLFNMAGIQVGKDFKGVVINQKGEKRLQNK